MVKKIKKILVANRGEIALRVVRACRELGIQSVAIYSDADRHALHVLAADHAVNIGSPEPKESYLNIKKIVECAKSLKCDAIHPGYGFLAENYHFAQQCEKEGLIFIGPNSRALRLVGDKLRSRQIMAEAGIPIIPGMNSADSNIKNLQDFARKVGYPVIVKASGGGGGKGMRIVHKPSELVSSIEAGRREAKSAFGDDTVYIEKYLEKPRHIEFQVLADNYGDVIHLFERECSIQRRYQKIIEESPSFALDVKLRTEMGEIAKKVMVISHYNNAGTVEFLLDTSKNFYFLEVNARIQVEHPVTEMVVGIDLVKQQIRLAGGEKLKLKQKDLNQRGHAIECRIYAEDPENNFYPSIGRIHLVKEPVGPGIRCDSGIYSGWEVPFHYDPILSKLIVWDENREGAVNRMASALSEYVILGIKTQIQFLMEVIKHPEFRTARLHTHFIKDHFSDWRPKEIGDYLPVALIASAIIKMEKPVGSKETVSKSALSPWQLFGKWEFMSSIKK